MISHIKQIFENQAVFFKEEASMTLSFRLSALTKLEEAILKYRDEIHQTIKKMWEKAHAKHILPKRDLCSMN